MPWASLIGAASKAVEAGVKVAEAAKKEGQASAAGGGDKIEQGRGLMAAAKADLEATPGPGGTAYAKGPADDKKLAGVTGGEKSNKSNKGSGQATSGRETGTAVAGAVADVLSTVGEAFQSTYGSGGKTTKV